MTSSSQILGMMMNEECGMDEFWKMADNCSDKDKDKDLSTDKTGPRTRSSQTDRIQTARMPSIRDGVLRVKGQSFTDDQESRTTEAILPLTTRMDMECQTLPPTTKGTF